MAILSRYLPLAGVGLFFAAGIFWRMWHQYRRHGHTGLILFRSARWQENLREGLFIVLFVAPLAQAAAYAAWPESLAGACLVPPPTGGAWLVTGGFLLLGGTALTVAAQLQMGASWRIGIEDGASPGLITGGPYCLCRNPIFLGMFIVLAGLMVLLPTWVSAAILICTIAGVRAQVLEEEKYLATTYGETYRGYAGRVGRFLPGLGIL